MADGTVPAHGAETSQVAAATPAPVSVEPSAPQKETAAPPGPSTEAPLEVAPSATDTPAAPASLSEAKGEKPAEVAAEPAAEPVPDVAAEAQPEKPPVPTYTELKMPEGMTADAATMSAATNIFGKYGLPQDGAQELIDFHGAQIKAVADQMGQRQRDVFVKMQQGWRKQAEKEFGNRFDTVVENGQWAIANYGGSKKEVAELRAFLAYSGGDHNPSVMRVFNTMARKLRERSAPPQSKPANAQDGQTAWEKRYGTRT